MKSTPLLTYSENTFAFKAVSISICICICLHTSKRQKYDRNVWSDPFNSNAKYFPLTELMDWQNDDEIHTANVYSQTADKLIFSSVDSTQ